MTGDQPPRSKTADRILRILSLFLEHDGPLGIAELSRLAGFDKSVVHRVVSTMLQHGYLEQELPSRKYRLGIRVWELGQKYSVSSWIDDVAVPLLSEVLAEHGSTGYVASLEGTEIVYLATVEGTGPFQVSVELGSRMSAATTAIGHAILACLPEDDMEKVLDAVDFEALQRSNAHVPTTREVAEQGIREARTRGYAINPGRSRVGVGAVGAPITGAQGAPVAGLSIAFPMMSEYEHLWDILPREVVRIADQISKHL